MKSEDNKAINVLHKTQCALTDHSANTLQATSRAQVALWMLSLLYAVSETASRTISSLVLTILPPLSSRRNKLETGQNY